MFWNTITPKEGDKIPDGAEFKSGDVWLNFSQYLWLNERGNRDRFGPVDGDYEWRIPMEVVPIDIAVAIAYEAAYAVQSGAVIGSGFREFIATKLRERAKV